MESSGTERYGSKKELDGCKLGLAKEWNAYPFQY